MLSPSLALLYNTNPDPISAIVNSVDCLNNKEPWDDLKVKLGLQKPCPQALTPIIINTNRANYFNNSPYYTVDIYSNIEENYSELNDDKSVIKAVTKYYYYKFLEKFLLSDMNDLLGFLKIKNGSVQFIKNKRDYSYKNDTAYNTDKKIKFLEKKFITKKIIYRIIKNYVSLNDIVWYKIQNNEYEFKKFLHKELKKIFENNI